MSNYLKRFLSLAMAVIMVLAYVPATAFAEEPAVCSHSYENGVCTQCGAEEIEEEPTECSHAYGEGVVTPPTCSAEGYTTYTCTVCGESYTDNKQEATGVHTYENGACTACGAEEIEEEPTACSHVYDEGVVTPPTCGAEGYTTYTCTVCGESYTDNKQEATGVHTYENGTCTVCGGAEPAPVEEPVTPPVRPTATVTEIENEDLTFAMNFKTDEVTEAQLAYYGDWYADFELTVNQDVTFDANGTADGWLSGQYDAWSENWVNVPFDPVTLEANKPLKIMEYAAELLGEPGLKYTYKEVYENVKDFDCGVFFAPEFLLGLEKELKVTLELRMYNPADESESYIIGETYTYVVPVELELPTATVTEIENEDLTFAMNFKTDEVTEAQLAYYGDWYADFELTVNQDVTFDANGTADGWLSGQYDAWSENWVSVPFDPVTLEANKPLKIMEYAAELLGEPGLKYTYKEVYENVKDFDCGVFFAPEFLLGLEKELKVTLELRMYNPADESESYIIGETYTYVVPVELELPTATVTEIENEDLTFAMNFKTDEVTEAQLAYYGDWYADFELTVNQDVTFDANGTADGWLSGQYDAWSENWVNVPFDPVTLGANKPLKIMEYAAELLGEPGLKYTYKEVYENVRDFDCGVFFAPEFLLGLEKELKVTLELRMYNPADESESYIIGETYTYVVPVELELPTATVSDIVNEDLTFAMNFKTDEVTEAQLAYYGDWYADFELTVNQDVTFDANGTADGWLSGQYDAWSENWVNVPFDPVTLEANKPLKIMEYAVELLGEPGLKYTYKEVYENVKDFDCGVFFTPEFLAANPDLKVTLELKMYHPKDESISYRIGETYIFENNFVAYNTASEKLYTTVSAATMAAKAGETVKLLRDVTESVVFVTAGVTLDLNGHVLTADYASCFGNTVDSDEAKGGTLNVDLEQFLIRQDNAMLPVKTAGGYKFVEVRGFNTAMTENGKFVFQPLFKGNAHELLKAGVDVTGVTVKVEINWKQKDGARSQEFKYNDDMLTGFINSANNGKYGKMFTLLLKGADGLEDLTYTAMVVSETGVQMRATGLRPSK